MFWVGWTVSVTVRDESSVTVHEDGGLTAPQKSVKESERPREFCTLIKQDACSKDPTPAIGVKVKVTVTPCGNTQVLGTKSVPEFGAPPLLLPKGAFG